MGGADRLALLVIEVSWREPGDRAVHITDIMVTALAMWRDDTDPRRPRRALALAQGPSVTVWTLQGQQACRGFVASVSR